MIPHRLADRIRAAPLLADPTAAADRLADLPADWPRVAEPPVRDLLLGIADHSPYLWRLASADPARLSGLLACDPDIRIEAICREVRAGCIASADEREAMRVLRRAKQEVALLAALADLGGIWDLRAVTAALSAFADVAVAAALDVLMRQAGQGGKLAPVEHASETGAGIVVLALGKHGSGELNYSSDIDVVVFFDPAAPALAAGTEPAPFFVRLTKALARLLQERTEDGYVFRVDLRLRPDPGSTAVAISVPAAFSYYETVGQNWERAALIKARPVAGDLALGRRFLADLAPFIWRKYFDYAAIADIHAMKRQIHAVRGHGAVAVAGHDVKLGRGGIREIEFFVQTQQLVFGGRRPNLRGARTLDTLAELHRDGWVTAEAVEALSAAYVFLRTVEHRLQMVADEQTQRLPADPAVLARFAQFCGFPTLDEFSATLTGHLRQVESHYARLFEHAPELASPSGNLVFVGTGDDPDTLDTLRKLGFRQPEAAAETVRGWHFGRRAAVQSARAREQLTELVPGLLGAFSGSGDPDAALAAFDAALAKLPAAVELFALLRSNTTLRELFADILGAAPRLAGIVTMRPHVLDAAIDPGNVSAPPDPDALRERIMRTLALAGSYEDFLDRARDVRQEDAFLIGVRLLAGTVAPADAGRAYSALAEAIVRCTLDRVAERFEAEHGRVPDGRCVVLGLGKLGSREMTAGSDLDLILIYDFDDARPQSTGARPLHAVQYFGRLTQRLVSALTVPTRRGPLYDVDLRLRPSGGKGPVATQFRGFVDYQRREAQTWEHMALSRARIVAGDDSLAAEVDVAVRAVLAAPRDSSQVATDVRDMRALITQAKGEGEGFDLKIAAGGLVDAEFAAQYLALAYGHAHPELLRPEPQAVLAAARDAGLLDAGEAADLIEGHRLLSDASQLVATSIAGRFEPRTAPEGVRRRIAAALALPDFATLERELEAARGRVRAAFMSLLQAEAAGTSPEDP